MYRTRLTKPFTERDPDGVKIYTISADGSEVDADLFRPRLEEVKAQRELDWSATPSFAIFHRGSSALYLVVAWWRNQNELFTSVSVREGDTWIEDPEKYSFCLWDLEVFWHERNSFVTHMYSGIPDLDGYRQDLKPPNN